MKLPKLKCERAFLCVFVFACAMLSWQGPSALAENCPFIAGDECDDCIQVVEGLYQGTTAGKTGEFDDTSCTDGDVIDVWHCFTAGSTGLARANLCLSEFDTSLAVFSACGGVQIVCNDDACGPAGEPARNSAIEWTVFAGETYYLRLSGYLGAVGDYTLALDILASPANGGEACASCTIIGDGVVVGSSELSDDRWYCYTAACAGRVTASTCTGTSFDTILTVFDACDGNMVVQDDVACGIQNRGSIVEWFADVNANYYINVSGFNGDTGLFTLDVSCDGCLEDPTGDFDANGIVDARDLVPFIAALSVNSASGVDRCAGDFDQSGAVDASDIMPMVTTLLRAHVPRSEGDFCSDCIAVTEGLYFGSTTDNTGYADESECADGDLIDEWYCFTASQTGYAVAGLCQSGFDTTLAIYRRCGGELIACNDDSCGPVNQPEWQSSAVWDTTAGETYYLRISGFLNETGDYTLYLNSFDSMGEFQLDGEDCARSINLSEGATQGATDFAILGARWYRYTATCVGRVSISTCAGTDFDTILTVYDRCDGSVIVQDDDACGLQNLGSIVRWFVQPGQSFLVEVRGYNGATGPFELNVECAPCFEIPHGDFNDDRRVNALDMRAFIEALLDQSCTASSRCAGDFDQSGMIDANDVAPMISRLLSENP